MQQIQNLELKYFCDDFKEIRKVLKELGAQKEITKNKKTIFLIYHLRLSKKEEE